MSADNGVYVAKCQDGYRVKHCQAIENVEDDPQFPEELTDSYRTLYFNGCKVFQTDIEAFMEAKRIYDEIMAGDFPVVEYGISEIDISNRPFKTDVLEAGRINDDYWEWWFTSGKMSKQF